MFARLKKHFLSNDAQSSNRQNMKCSPYYKIKKSSIESLDDSTSPIFFQSQHKVKSIRLKSISCENEKGKRL